MRNKSGNMEYEILLDGVSKVKSFVNTVSRFSNDMDIMAGRYVIDAKSIMGIFSVDLTRVLKLVVYGDTQEEFMAIEEKLQEYFV